MARRKTCSLRPCESWDTFLCGPYPTYKTVPVRSFVPLLHFRRIPPPASKTG